MSIATPYPAHWIEDGWKPHVTRDGRWSYPVWQTLAELTAPRERKLWGQPHRITPELVETVFGDGQQIIGFCPLNTRPNYYVVRVDSGWELSNWEWNHPEPFIDHTDEVYSAIEDEYGSARWCKHCGGEEGDCEETDPPHEFDRENWPALNEEVGSEWFLLERLDELEPARV